jgi:hypothetical protein
MFKHIVLPCKNTFVILLFLYNIIIQYIILDEIYFIYFRCRLQTEYNLNSIQTNIGGDLICGLVVRVLGYRSEMYCVSCEVRTEFIYAM